ncbi:hypothetical protein BpHYR1_048827 [Brachionus plicatilis]|uniref:Uncharacterized protein n=1 Tax=Brachionus plicatilis TaxID=10195 RepID=A0A3M7Q3N6_BRAPC|nr:hypothetical protein BpHYR1_048827 [Brachionus plicatilis]
MYRNFLIVLLANNRSFVTKNTPTISNWVHLKNLLFVFKDSFIYIFFYGIIKPYLELIDMTGAQRLNNQNSF